VNRGSFAFSWTVNGTPTASTTLLSAQYAELIGVDSGTLALTTLTATGTIGYTTGAGGTVTQATNKSTTVVLNKAAGQITMNGAALASNTTVSFTLTNSVIATVDTVDVHRASVGTAGAYNIWVDSVGSGSCVISVRNITAGSLSEALVLNFSVCKGASS